MCVSGVIRGALYCCCEMLQRLASCFCSYIRADPADMTWLHCPPYDSPSAADMTGPTENTIGKRQSRCMSPTARTGSGPAQATSQMTLIFEPADGSSNQFQTRRLSPAVGWACGMTVWVATDMQARGPLSMTKEKLATLTKVCQGCGHTYNSAPGQEQSRSLQSCSVMLGWHHVLSD